MGSSHWPLILIEGVLVFGGALAFGWWQLRSVKRDRDKMLAERRAREAQNVRDAHPAQPTNEQTDPPRDSMAP